MHNSVYFKSMVTVFIGFLITAVTGQPTLSMDNYGSINQVNQVGKVVVIPLDDRPVNVDFIKENAKIGGMTVIMPPNEIIGDMNNPGESDKLLQWVLAEGEDASHFIISATMMNHGGLIHSRLTEEKDSHLLDWVDIVNNKFPNKKIYVYDVIQRLATSVFTDHDLDNYNNIRKWAIWQDKLKVDPSLLENISNIEAEIGEEFLNKYIKTREINHKINLGLIEKASEGKIDLLILGQDDASEFGLHNQEQTVLTKAISAKGVSDKVSIVVGADELGLSLLARVSNEINNVTPTYKIFYSNPEDKEWVGPFDDRSLDDVVREKIDIINGTIVDNNADINLFINKENSGGTLELGDNIINLIENGENVSLIDLRANGKEGPKLIPYLSNEIDLMRLSSYSGWNTVGNAVGVGISNANIKFNYDVMLSSPFGGVIPQIIKDEQAKASHKFLYSRLAKDFAYKQKALPKINGRLREMGIESSRIDASELPVVKKVILEELNIELRDINKSFGRDSNLEYLISDVSLPWSRLFEIVIKSHCLEELESELIE